MQLDWSSKSGQTKRVSYVVPVPKTDTTSDTQPLVEIQCSSKIFEEYVSHQTKMNQRKDMDVSYKKANKSLTNLFCSFAHQSCLVAFPQMWEILAPPHITGTRRDSSCSQGDFYIQDRSPVHARVNSISRLLHCMPMNNALL